MKIGMLKTEDREDLTCEQTDDNVLITATCSLLSRVCLYCLCEPVLKDRK